MTRLAPFYARAADQYVIQNARQDLQAECLKQHGINGVAVRSNLAKQLAAEREADSVLYGITDPGLARHYGYSPSPALVQGPPSQTAPSPGVSTPTMTAVPVNPSTAPAKGDDVLTSCVHQAQSSIYGGDQYAGIDPFQRGQNLAIQAWLDSKTDPRVVVVWADWRNCMKTKGYNPPGDPVDPKLFPTRTGDQQAPPDEVTAALADIGCKTSTSFVARWSTVVDQLEAQAYANNKAALDADQQHLAKTLDRARHVLATH